LSAVFEFILAAQPENVIAKIDKLQGVKGNKAMALIQFSINFIFSRTT